jgi:IclR family pca regulon transcriptional regulator
MQCSAGTVEAMEGDRDATSSMGRGFDVLSALAELTQRAPFRATVSAVAAHLGRDRSQVSRTLTSLDALGLVARDSDRTYRVGWDWYAAPRS